MPRTEPHQAWIYIGEWHKWYKQRYTPHMWIAVHMVTSAQQEWN